MQYFSLTNDCVLIKLIKTNVMILKLVVCINILTDFTFAVSDYPYDW